MLAIINTMTIVSLETTIILKIFYFYFWKTEPDVHLWRCITLRGKEYGKSTEKPSASAEKTPLLGKWHFFLFRFYRCAP